MPAMHTTEEQCLMPAMHTTEEHPAKTRTATLVQEQPDPRARGRCHRRHQPTLHRPLHRRLAQRSQPAEETPARARWATRLLAAPMVQVPRCWWHERHGWLERKLPAGGGAQSSAPRQLRPSPPHGGPAATARASRAYRRDSRPPQLPHASFEQGCPPPRRALRVRHLQWRPESAGRSPPVREGPPRAPTRPRAAAIAELATPSGARHSFQWCVSARLEIGLVAYRAPHERRLPLAVISQFPFASW